MNDRDRILERLPTSSQAARNQDEDAAASGDWGLFRERLEALGGEMRTLESLTELEGRGAVWDDRLADLARQLALRPADVWDADLGLSFAAFGVAETGTLILASGTESRRLGSLAPPLNVVVVGELVATLSDAFARGMPSSTTVLVTGPSRTADIEGILVRGVHGPGVLWVVRND